MRELKKHLIFLDYYVCTVKNIMDLNHINGFKFLVFKHCVN
jgi:hypothetical protein